MCTRFFIESESPLLPVIEKAKASPLAQKMTEHIGKPMNMTGEIRPTAIAAVLAPNKDGRAAAFPMLWGFTVSDGNAPIVNCRLETASKKPLWKDSWYRRRCVIPASWYLEWEHLRQPDGRIRTGRKYTVQPRDAEVTYLAGLYRFETRRGGNYPVFAVLTRQPTAELAALHDRMPLILPKDALSEWIRLDGEPDYVAQNALTDMVIEKAE